MKKLYFIPLIIIVIMGMILGSCAKPAATTTTPPTTSIPPTTSVPPTTSIPPTTVPPTTVPPTTAKPAPYGTVTVADLGWPANESLDPCNVESTWGWEFYDALLRWDQNGVLIPGVADSWTVNGTTITFKIHKGIKFWNGDDLTAEDVKFSMDRFSDLSQSTNPWSYFLSKVYNQVDTKVLDDYTFQFIQDHPEPSQLVIMAWVRILPKKYFESVGVDYFRSHPIGSGPWIFKELISKTSITFEANTNYWIPDEIPVFQTYKELYVPEVATAIDMLKAGEVDILAMPPRDKINELVKDGFTAFKIGVPGTCSLVLQGSWFPADKAGPISDNRVREALSYAINRQELCDTLYSGYATPGGQFYEYPGGYGWSDALGPDPYDPAKAEELLKEANYPAAFANPVINCYTDATNGGLFGGPDLFLLLQSYWQKVGLQVKVNVVDSGVASGYIFNGFTRFKGTEQNIGWIGCWNYDAFFNATYQSANMYCSWGVHNAGNDPVADAMYKKATTDTNPVTAEQEYKDFQVYAKSMYVNIGVAQTDSYVIWNPDTIGGWIGRTWVSFWDSTYGIQHAK